MLYPVENKVREVKNLSGIWNFKMDYDNVGTMAEDAAERYDSYGSSFEL